MAKPFKRFPEYCLIFFWGAEQVCVSGVKLKKTTKATKLKIF